MAGFTILTVTQITSYLKSFLSENPKLSGIYIRGEIADFRGNYSSGHLYFSLKDSSSEISCVMFRSYAERMKFVPVDGMSVIVRCDLSVYQKTGACQLYVYDIQPEGLGAKHLAFEQLKEKLYKEGLFDSENKKSIPRYPEKIGVITSAQGAAVHDIITVLERRWPIAKIALTPVAVQGDDAPEQLVSALLLQENEVKPDIIIIGRGGGSSDDLSAFNDETLARTVFSCSIPVISAVGHETDYSICDFVADLRAPTPSAAAELASPDIRELRQTLDSNIEWLNSILAGIINGYDVRLKELSAVKRFSLTGAQEQLSNAYAMLCKGMESVVETKKKSYSEALFRLDSASPTKILKKTFCSAVKDGKKIKSAGEMNTGDVFEMQFIDGKIISEVKDKIMEDFG